MGMKCELGEVDTGGHRSEVSCFLKSSLASPCTSRLLAAVAGPGFVSSSDRLLLPLLILTEIHMAMLGKCQAVALEFFPGDRSLHGFCHWPAGWAYVEWVHNPSGFNLQRHWLPNKANQNHNNSNCPNADVRKWCSWQGVWGSGNGKTI